MVEGGQQVAALIDCKAAQYRLQIVDGKDIEALRAILRRSAYAAPPSDAAAAQPAQEPADDPARDFDVVSDPRESELTSSVLRRTHAVLYVLSRMLLSSDPNACTTVRGPARKL